MSVGLAFYGGMKLKQLQRLHTVKVGTLVVEFQDNRCGFKKPTIVKPVVKPVPKPIPTPVIVIPPKTDVEKVLEPEKVKEEEPTLMKLDAYDRIQKIETCFEDLEKIDSKENQWDHVKKFKECKIMEFTAINCAYLEEKSELDACIKEQNDPARLAARDYDDQLDKENGNKGFYGNIKEKVKEAIEETNDENID